MEKGNLTAMIRGWFVGNFSPSLYKTNDVEVAVKRYKAGDHEEWHYHKVATEITTVIDGKIEMNGEKYGVNDIVVLSPGEGSNFIALTDTTTVVVKLPGANNDKYLKGE